MIVDGAHAADPLDPKALQPFQRRFIRALESGDYDELCLSIPRGGGKTWLGAHLLARCLTPGDPLNVRGAEYMCCAASLQQARLVFRFLRAALDREPYRRRWSWQDSSQVVSVRDVVEGTRVRVIASTGKTAMGLVGVPLVVADEPGAWTGVHGDTMRAALSTAIGKPGNRMRVVYIGTLAPASPNNWWPRLVNAGTEDRTYVMLFQGDAEKWSKWSEVKRCNPLVGIDPATARRLKSEQRAALSDEQRRAEFTAYRLNQPLMGSASSLCTVTEWNAVGRAAVKPRGRYPAVVGVDLGAGKSWSAAVAWWHTGRVECFALAPGDPGLRELERRDRQPRGLYTRLVKDGSLLIDHGLKMQRAAPLIDEVFDRWGGRPGIAVIVCDRFRGAETLDAVRGRCPVMRRVSRWSEASEDIQAFRRAVRDGPLSLPQVDWDLMFASLAQTTIRSDEKGLYRIEKDPNGSGRDDVCAAAVLAAGVMDRRIKDAFPDPEGTATKKEGDDEKDGDAQGAEPPRGLYRIA